jgi:homoserine kinase type II
MAVYTKISFLEVQQQLQNYAIGNLLELKEIVEGIDNSNFFLKTDQGKFILTIFEKRISADDLPFFVNLKQHLAAKNILCPTPIKNNQSEIISQIKDKKSIIVSFLEGKNIAANKQGFYQKISKNHCYQLGNLISKLHIAASDFSQQRVNDLGYLTWQKLFNKIENNLINFDQKISDEIKENIDFVASNWRANLESGVCHLDIFPDNIFFDEQNNLSAIIDFYFAASDLLIYDLAIAINAWCFDERNIFDQTKFLSIIEGYQKNRIIKKTEIDFLDVALLASSIRFTLTRFHDMFFSPPNSLVKIKNPQEFIEKMRFFKKNKISQFL